MKKLFTFILFSLSAHMARAAGSQPGNWQWQYNNQSPAASIGQGITVNHAQDVIVLRWQVYSGTLTTNGGQVFLQYYDGGTTGGSGYQTQYGYPMPMQTYRDHNSATGSSFDRYSPAALTGSWHTVADANVAHNSTSLQDDPSGTGSYFVMANPDNTITDQQAQTYTVNPAMTNSNNITAAATNNLIQLGAPYSAYRSFNLNTAETQYFTKINGNSTPQTSTSNTVVEFVFRIKPSWDFTRETSAIQVGHRYFFRLRGYGNPSTGPNAGTNGYSSPYGSNNGQNSFTYSGNTYTNMGDYSSLAPMPYLDIPLDFIPKTLPVRYAQPLTASLHNGTVNLYWTSATELSNKGYAVLAGTNTANMKQIDFVSSKASNGTSSTGYSYTSQDKSPVNNTTNYYQLKQVDLDGNTEPSDMVSIYVTGGTDGGITLAPNPVIDQLNVSNAKIGSTIRIISMVGQIVKTAIVQSSLVTIDGLQSLPSGIYITSVINRNGQPETHKFLKK
ncbi:MULTISPECIES: T9SS type A sorting domain-containing protein [Chitinophagaceae]